MHVSYTHTHKHICGFNVAVSLLLSNCLFAPYIELHRVSATISDFQFSFHVARSVITTDNWACEHVFVESATPKRRTYVTPPPDHTNVKQRGTLNLPMSPRFRVRGIDLSLIIYHPAVSQGPAGIHDKRRNYSSGSNAHEPHN